jgi:hypothetical protein
MEEEAQQLMKRYQSRQEQHPMPMLLSTTTAIHTAMMGPLGVCHLGSSTNSSTATGW